MTRYAVATHDLDLAWSTFEGAALLSAALEDDDEPETVSAEPGLDACVLGGSADVVEAVARGLLSLQLPITPPRCARVYARAAGERKWTRLGRPEDVPYGGQTPESVDGSPRIDEEIVNLSAPMDDATRQALRASLLEEGCRDPLIVWAESDVLLDGHNRLALCRELGIPFRVERRSFPDRDAAVAWFISAQRARRSLTPHWATYYLGRQYNAAKQDRAENLRRGGEAPKGQFAPSGRASEPIAQAAGVDEKTVRRAAAFAEAVDRLERAVPRSRRAVLNRELKLSCRQIAQAVEDGVGSIDELRELTTPGEIDVQDVLLRKIAQLNPLVDTIRARGSMADVRAHPRMRIDAVREAIRALTGFLAELAVYAGEENETLGRHAAPGLQRRECVVCGAPCPQGRRRHCSDGCYRELQRRRFDRVPSTAEARAHG